MPEVEFEFVDVSTWRTPAEKEFDASEAEKKRIFEASLVTIGSVTPVSKRRFTLKNRPYNHLLVVLANKEPMSVLYYHIKTGKDGKSVVEFHSKTRAGLTIKFTRKRGESPLRSLFWWMRRKAGKNARIKLFRPTKPGRRMVDKLVRDGALKPVGWRKETEIYSFGKKRSRRRTR